MECQLPNLGSIEHGFEVSPISPLSVASSYAGRVSPSTSANLRVRLLSVRYWKEAPTLYHPMCNKAFNGSSLIAPQTGRQLAAYLAR
ncbi:hypothetical protein AB1N83_013022 [Pleurotus pulmonarius]